MNGVKNVDATCFKSFAEKWHITYTRCDILYVNKLILDIAFLNVNIKKFTCSQMYQITKSLGT